MREGERERERERKKVKGSEREIEEKIVKHIKEKNQL